MAELLDPEVEALLQEIAADPRSSLLRVPRPKVLRGLFERGSRAADEPATSARATGLTSAERQLLLVHRCEVAALLREACVLRLFEEPRAAEEIGRDIDVRRRIEIPDEDAWRARARREMDAVTDDSETTDAYELLLRCVHPADESRWGEDASSARPSAAQLATSSLRVAAHDSARICVGVDLIRRDEPRTALRVLESVLAGAPSALHASNAHENVGWARAASGDAPAARDAYRAAALCGEPRPTPLASWLFHALDAADRPDVLDAAARLDELVEPDHPSLADWLKGVRRKRAERGRGPSPATKKLLESLADELGDTSRRIASAFE